MLYLSPINPYYHSGEDWESQGRRMKWTEARRCWQSFWMYTKGGKDLIPGWKLKELAESALATGGIEGLRRYYEACLTGSCHGVKTTLERDRRKTLESERERFIAIYLGAAR
jgi:hypothetical protein